jgi:hypothetical protein
MLQLSLSECGVVPLVLFILIHRVVSLSLGASFTAVVNNSRSTQLSEVSTQLQDGPVSDFGPTDNIWATDPYLRKSCYSSWGSDFQSISTRESSNETVLDIYTEIYETIRSFGPGTFSTLADGVPRFRFTESVTRFEPLTVTITKTQTLNYPTIVNPLSEAPKCVLAPKSEECELLWGAFHGQLKASDAIFTRVPIPPRAPCWLSRRCELQLGNEVVLIYWPPDDSAANDLKKDEPSRTVVTTAIEFKGQDLYLRSRFIHRDGTDFHYDDEWRAKEDEHDKYNQPVTMFGNYTFVSPTLYLAHHAVTAVVGWELAESGQRWKEAHSLRAGGVIPLNSTDLYSLAPIHHNTLVKNGIHYAQQVMQGQFNPSNILQADNGYNWVEPIPYSTKRFDFDDLRGPVPADKYFDARHGDCWARQSHCGTITEGNYRPRLYIKGGQWRSMLPDNIDCAVPDLVDPPLVLSKLDVPIEPLKLSIANPMPTPMVVTPGASFYEGFVQGITRPARPGVAITPPFPRPTGSFGDSGRTFRADNSAIEEYLETAKSDRGGANNGGKVENGRHNNNGRQYGDGVENNNAGHNSNKTPIGGGSEHGIDAGFKAVRGGASHGARPYELALLSMIFCLII